MLWSVQLLGGLCVRSPDGREVTRLRTRKVGALLAQLALRGGAGQEVSSRERLCALLWPDAEEGVARHNLSNA